MEPASTDEGEGEALTSSLPSNFLLISLLGGYTPGVPLRLKSLPLPVFA